ncbi:hypothetical protein ACOMHN_042212 [Nucella lapillus]
MYAFNQPVSVPVTLRECCHYTHLKNPSSIPGVGYRGSRPAPPLMRSRISPCSVDRRVDPVPPRRLPHRLAFNRCPDREESLGVACVFWD